MHMYHPTNPIAHKWLGNAALLYDYERARKVGIAEESRIVEAFLEECEPGSTVADIPSGTGRAARPIIERRLRYIGVDISPDMIAVCQRRIAKYPHAEAFVADARATALQHGEADYLISVKFIKWLSTNQMVLEALSEFRRICRKQALVNVKVVVPGKPQPRAWSRITYAIRTRSLAPRVRSNAIKPSTFEALCGQAGWKIAGIQDNPVSLGSRFYLLGHS